jgi:hypothetical protein
LPTRRFRNTFGSWEVHRSAFKHGVPTEDSVHAATHALIVYPIDGDGGPPRELRLGPSRAGNLLELVILQLDDGRDLIIHSMPMRPKYGPLLAGGEE